MDVTAGDTVLYGKWSGMEINIPNKDDVILRETDSLGVEA